MRSRSVSIEHESLLEIRAARQELTGIDRASHPVHEPIFRDRRRLAFADEQKKREHAVFTTRNG
jgi:hypothetical protein